MMERVCRKAETETEAEEQICKMPGCTNERADGHRLCPVCRGEDSAPAPAGASTVSFGDPNAVRKQVFMGIGSSVKSIPGKQARKRPHNWIPREKATCPCGKNFARPVRGWGSKRKHCDEACRRKYYLPPTGRANKKTKYIFTAEMDAQIGQVYRELVGMQAPGRAKPVKDLAARWGFPHTAVSKRARNLGVLVKMPQDPVWTEEEVELLVKYSHRSPEWIRKHLAEAGYIRSATAIVLKRKRLGGSMLNGGYSLQELSRLMGIDVHSVSRWIEQGFLEAEKRGSNRTAVQGGDIWLIRPENLVQFVRSFVAIIDFRKVDKYWLVELLCGPGRPQGSPVSSREGGEES